MIDIDGYSFKRDMNGLFSSLTEEQKKKALSYEGEENFGKYDLILKIRIFVKKYYEWFKFIRFFLTIFLFCWIIFGISWLAFFGSITIGLWAFDGFDDI